MYVHSYPGRIAYIRVYTRWQSYRHNDTKYKVYFHLYKYTAGVGRRLEYSGFSAEDLGGGEGGAR